MKYRLLPTAAAAVLAVGPAIAGSYTPVYIEPEIPVEIQEVYDYGPGVDWHGFYIGALGGMQTGEVIEITVPTVSNADLTTYGVFAGYNYAMGNFVLGAEVDAQMGSGTIGVTPVSVDYLVDARARLGYSFGKVLAYGAGGYSWLSATDGGTLTVSGFNVGAGLELAVTDKIFVGGEYIYRDMSGTHSVFVPPDYDANLHGFQARAGFRF